MVKLLVTVLIFCWTISLNGAVNVTVQLIAPVESTPIQGIITITHEPAEKVDPQSFRLNNQPFKAEFVQDKKGPPFSSTYHFQMDAMAKGLYLLPTVSVQVDGKVYSAPSVSFQVSGLSAPRTTNQGALALETYVLPAFSLYPGQRLQLVYRIYYRTNIDLSMEELPLLDAKGFEKIGQKDIQDLQINGASVQQISQEVRALTAGNYPFPVSILEGYAYQEDASGARTYNPTKLHTETPAVTIEVVPFPEQGRPGSFEGAIGSYTLSTKLLTSTQMAVGDNIRLELTIEGKGEWATVAMPAVNCQPGFSGFFLVNDLPAETQSTESTKTFKLELRPLTSAAHQIPSIEFSYFDPTSRSYHALHSDPIPIAVRELATVQEKKTTKEQNIPWKEAWQQPIASYTRQQQVNGALKELLKKNLTDGSSLWQIGDSYFDLGEYPLAIFYYSKALQLRPYSFTLNHQLNQAQSKLGLPESSYLRWPPYRWALVLVYPVGVMAAALFLLYLWLRQRRWLQYSALLASSCALLFAYGFFTKYLSPIEGVLIQTTLLYPTTSKQYPPISPEPLVSGLKVRVVDVEEKGHWLKVLTPSGRVGYVDYQAMRLLDTSEET